MAQDINLTHSSLAMNSYTPPSSLGMNYSNREPSYQNNTMHSYTPTGSFSMNYNNNLIDLTYPSLILEPDILIKNYDDEESSHQSNTSSTTQNNASSSTTSKGALYATANVRPHLQGLRSLGISMNSRRNASQTQIRGMASACIDQDDSGTYDPDESGGRAAKAQPRRAKRPRKDDGEVVIGEEPKPPRHSIVGYSLPVTLVLKSEKGLEYLRSITPGPYDSQDTNLDEPSKSPDPDNETPLPRRKIKKPNRLGAGVARTDGLTISQLTSGHPQRRGCKSCFEAGDDECSLIDDSYAYPCDACDDSSIDCVFIVPPELKKVCETCKLKRISCSYRIDGGVGVDKCVACREVGSVCCAGPLRSGAYLRGVEEGKPQEQKGPGDVADALHADDPDADAPDAGAPDAALGATLDTSSNPTPTPERTQIRKTDTKEKALLTNNLTKRKSKHHSLDKKNHFNIHQPEPRLLHRSPSPLSTTTHGIHHIHIRTSFAHPLAFNHVPAPNGTSPCSWCSLPLFGLFGHGPRTVEVLPSPSGHGFEEIGRGEHQGHNQLGQHRSRMCVPCTFARVAVLACPGHGMCRIEGVDPRVMNTREWARALEALVDGDGDGERSGLVRGARWCSVCPALAEWECQRESEDEDISMEEEEGMPRCALLLCEDCKDLMGKIELQGRVVDPRGEDIGVLDQLVRMVDEDKYQYPVGVRADASFLTVAGELNVRLGKGFGLDDEREMVIESEMPSSSSPVMEARGESNWRGGAGAGAGAVMRGRYESQGVKGGEKRKREIEVVVISDDED